jgi:membrane protein
MHGRWQRCLIPFLAAARLWARNDCSDLSAAFAYHTLQSIFPALLIVLSVASRLLGADEDLLSSIQDIVARVLPPANLPIFESTLQRFTRQGFGAGILGLVLLVLSSSNIYLTLQRGADRLWWNRPFGLEHLRARQLVARFLGLRLKAFFLLLVVVLFLALDQFVSSIRVFGSAFLHDLLTAWLPIPLQRVGSFSRGLDLLISLLITFVNALFLLWALPSRRVPLRPLLPAAMLVSFAATLLNLLLPPLLLTLGVRFQAYGVVGGILALTLWVWLVGVILYYGQCLSVVMARRTRGWHSALHAGPPRPLPGPG